MNQTNHIKERLFTVYSQNDLQRIQIKYSLKGEIYMVIDVHGMTRNEARRFINNVIGIAHTNFNLTVIHGFNHGTAIKEMLECQFDNIHITNKLVDPINPGRTYLSIA